MGKVSQVISGTFLTPEGGDSKHNSSQRRVSRNPCYVHSLCTPLVRGGVPEPPEHSQQPLLPARPWARCPSAQLPRSCRADRLGLASVPRLTPRTAGAISKPVHIPGTWSPRQHSLLASCGRRAWVLGKPKAATFTPPTPRGQRRSM